MGDGLLRRFQCSLCSADRRSTASELSACLLAVTEPARRIGRINALFLNPFEYRQAIKLSWKLGRKGVDDGVLMVVAKDDRRLWIEVGYGLEGPLPDAIAKRIVSEVFSQLRVWDTE